MTHSLISQKNSPGIERLPEESLEPPLLEIFWGKGDEGKALYRAWQQEQQANPPAKVGQVAPRKPRQIPLPGIERLPEGRLAGFCCDEGNCPECLRAYREGLAFMRQERAARMRQERAARKLRQSSPDGLKTAAQAATKLNCSIKTLNAHVAAGDLRYVSIGKGTKRRRIRFADSDINEFIAAQTRKVTPCPSTRTRARRTGNLTSGGEVIDFTAPRRPRPSGKRKP